MLEITVKEVKMRLDAGDEVFLLDVRESEELSICCLAGAEHIPMLQLFTGLQKPAAPQGSEIIVFCHHGIRSLEAAQFLRLNGYETARSMAGGIEQWAVAIDPDMTRY